MRLVDLEEWSVLKAAQCRLLKVVAAAIADADAGTDGGASCPDEHERDMFEFIRYELLKLVITIPTHKEFEPNIITQFRSAASDVFLHLEKILSVRPRTEKESKRKEMWRKWWEWECECNRYPDEISDTGTIPGFGSLVICPLSDTKAWSSILSALTAFNENMERLLRTRTKTSTSVAEGPKPVAMSLDADHKLRVQHVVESLRELISKCTSDESHQILLELAGQKWSGSSVVTNPVLLFLSACFEPYDWQAVECLPSRPADECFDSKLELISDLCRSILDSQNYDETIQVLFTERRLYKSKTKRTHSRRQSTVPSKSIKALLDDNSLLPFKSDLLCGGSASDTTFTIQEKREFALNLAWSFLHLFNFPWIESGWSADKIFLLSSSNNPAAPVLLHRSPYISCGPPNASPKPPRPNDSIVSDSVFLSLGKLLVEIETGQNVVVTERNRRGELSLWLTIDRMISDNQMSLACDDYIQAIEGCLSLHRSITGFSSGETNVHSTKQIYDEIVANLERDFGHYRRPNLKRSRSEQNLETPYFESKHVTTSSSSLYKDLGQATTKAPAEMAEPALRITNQLPEHPAKRRRDYLPSHQLCAREMSSDTGSQMNEMRPQNETTHKTTKQRTICKSSSDFQPPSSRQDFEVAIICALGGEYAAIEEVIDEFWDNDGDLYGKVREDDNNYSTGRIGKHNVVLVQLPHMGKLHASRAAKDIRLSYGAVKLVLVVGVCGAVPKYGKGEILLGDVIIGNAIIPYDFGRSYGDKFRPKTVTVGSIGRSNKDIRTLTDKYETPRIRNRLEKRTANFLEELQTRVAEQGRADEYECPGSAEDKLFRSDYRHRHLKTTKCICSASSRDVDPVCDQALKATCAELGCDEMELVIRKRRSDPRKPKLHVGAIASGDMVLKSGTKRDSIAGELDVIAFEMEGAGVWDELPCLVIKGVCDYADSHKAKNWQGFAAATAASAAKAILERYIQTDKP